MASTHSRERITASTSDPDTLAATAAASIGHASRSVIRAEVPLAPAGGKLDLKLALAESRAVGFGIFVNAMRAADTLLEQGRCPVRLG